MTEEEYKNLLEIFRLLDSGEKARDWGSVQESMGYLDDLMREYESSEKEEHA